MSPDSFHLVRRRLWTCGPLRGGAGDSGLDSVSGLVVEVSQVDTQMRSEYLSQLDLETSWYKRHK